MKKCIKCGILKDPLNFYLNKKMKDGRLSICSECGKTYMIKYRVKNKEQLRLKQAEYRENPARIAYMTTYMKPYMEKYSKTEKAKEADKIAKKKWQNNNQEKVKAHTILNNGIKGGYVEKQPCVFCEGTKVHGHHSDYSKPLEVIWVCPKHHRYLHKLEER